MTAINLTHIRGDSRRIAFTVLDQEAAPIDLTGAVVRLTIKENRNDANDDAIALKRSYYDYEIELTDPSAGEGVAKLEKADTRDEAVKTYFWDLEVSRQGDLRVDAQAGTIDVTNGSRTVSGSDTAFDKARPGDLLIPVDGVNAVNQQPVVIMAITSPTSILTDFEGWETTTGLSFAIKVADVKTPALGNFVVTDDVTR